MQETRLWDPDKNRTTSMRSKEEAHDYRYFPDPDLLPLVIDDIWIDDVRKSLPELPDAKKKRFIKEFSLSSNDADQLTSSWQLADFFEDCVRQFPDPRQVGNWIMGPLTALLNAEGKTISESPVSAKELAGLLKLIDDGIISGKIAKTIFEEMAQTGKEPDQIVKEKGLVQVTDASAIEEIVLKILAACPKEVANYKKGKAKLLGFFVGQVMKETKGKANPKIVNEVLKNKLKSCLYD